ncbi:MAG: response regulator transcription factor [Acidobacteria bacterium]|nr:response regulator transcription factor [Acidobacteriota bacterium]
MPRIRVLIADDHPVFRRGLRQVLESDSELEVVGEADDGQVALTLLRQVKPAVAVLDLDMPRLDGLEVIRLLRTELPEIAVVILTFHKDEELFNAAMALNVYGYILKDSAVTDIAASVHAASARQYFISPAISTYLVNRNRREAALAAAQPGVAALTTHERRLLQLIGAYQTNKEIAATLNISPRTVENHRANICQKLGLSGAHALLRFALEHKAELE